MDLSAFSKFVVCWLPTGKIICLTLMYIVHTLVCPMLQRYFLLPRKYQLRAAFLEGTLIPADLAGANISFELSIGKTLRCVTGALLSSFGGLVFFSHYLCRSGFFTVPCSFLCVHFWGFGLPGLHFVHKPSDCWSSVRYYPLCTLWSTVQLQTFLGVEKLQAQQGTNISRFTVFVLNGVVLSSALECCHSCFFPGDVRQLWK